jgi:hypothetical protein
LLRRRLRAPDSVFKQPTRHCEPTGRANARLMTGSAKQSTARTKGDNGLLRRFRLRSLSYGGQVASGNDGKIRVQRFAISPYELAFMDKLF